MTGPTDVIQIRYIDRYRIGALRNGRFVTRIKSHVVIVGLVILKDFKERMRCAI